MSITPDQISEVIKRQDAILWIDVVDPTPDELDLVGKEFKFHPLVMKDAARHQQRPKIDHHDGYVYLVFYCLALEQDHLEATEVDIFAGKNYLVTVHDDALAAISETARRWHESTEDASKRGVGLLVYSLLDTIVDGYFPIVDELADQIEDLETAIFERADTTAQARIFRLKKDLLDVRRVLGPERDVMNVLARRDAPIFSEHEIVYFSDVYDHILRITDAIDTYRDELSNALDAYQSVAANRLNEVVKRLTASSIILMTVTLIAGIYGMNFEHMPELTWAFGYPFALALMVMIAGGLAVLFRRIDWL